MDTDTLPGCVGYFGLTFKQIAAAEDVTCTFAVSRTQKFVLNGHFAIDVHTGSFKYPRQVVLSVWSLNKPILQGRPLNHGFYRVEIPLEISVAATLFKDALSRLGGENGRNL
jgi:hypothetical protein